MIYKSIRIREDIYEDLIRLQGYLQLRERRRLSLQEVIRILLQEFENKHDAATLEELGLSLVTTRRGRKK